MAISAATLYLSTTAAAEEKRGRGGASARQRSCQRAASRARSSRVADGTQFVADISIAKDIEGESSIKPYVRQGELGVVLDVAVVRHRELGL